MHCFSQRQIKDTNVYNFSSLVSKLCHSIFTLYVAILVCSARLNINNCLILWFDWLRIAKQNYWQEKCLFEFAAKVYSLLIRRFVFELLRAFNPFSRIIVYSNVMFVSFFFCLLKLPTKATRMRKPQTLCNNQLRSGQDKFYIITTVCLHSQFRTDKTTSNPNTTIVGGRMPEYSVKKFSVFFSETKSLRSKFTCIW